MTVTAVPLLRSRNSHPGSASRRRVKATIRCTCGRIMFGTGRGLSPSSHRTAERSVTREWREHRRRHPRCPDAQPAPTWSYQYECAHCQHGWFWPSSDRARAEFLGHLCTDPVGIVRFAVTTAAMLVAAGADG